MTKRSKARRAGQALPLTADQWALVTATASRGMSAALVYQIARKYHMEYEDLTGAALDALIIAARTFDPERGSTFQAYAYAKVRSALLDVVRKRARELKKQVAFWGQLPKWCRPGPPSVIDTRLRAAQLEGLREACRRLPVDHARIITAHYIEGIPLSNLAPEFGVAKRTIQRMHLDALARLRYQLSIMGLLPREDDN